MTVLAVQKQLNDLLGSAFYASVFSQKSRIW